MNTTSLQTRIARRLVRHAAKSLPTSRRDWADAMRAEFEHVDDRAALQWAFGCVVASYTEKWKVMDHSRFLIPKWLLAIEVSVCLFPASAAFFLSLWFIRFFLDKPSTAFYVLMMGIATTNLFLAMGFIAAARSLRYKFHLISALLFTTYAILQIGVMTLRGRFC